MLRILTIIILALGVSWAQFLSGFPFNYARNSNSNFNSGLSFIRNWARVPQNQRYQERTADRFINTSDDFEDNFDNSAVLKAVQEVLNRRGEGHRLVKNTPRYMPRGKIANNPYRSYVQTPY